MSPRRWVIAVLCVLIVILAAPFVFLPTEARLRRELVDTTPERWALLEARLEQAEGEGKPLELRHRFVPLSRIAPALQRAVVLGEDGHFWTHDGIDWEQTREAFRQAWAKRKLGRGASTITQQLVKNLYLSESRSPLRKLQEWVVARRLERVADKKRILELYLNVVELGTGVFGAEAAARLYFGTSASGLDPGQAAVLTAMLPSPRTRDPRRPNANLVRRSYKMARLMEQGGVAPAATVQARVEKLVGPRRKKGASTPKPKSPAAGRSESDAP